MWPDSGIWNYQKQKTWNPSLVHGHTSFQSHWIVFKTESFTFFLLQNSARLILFQEHSIPFLLLKHMYISEGKKPNFIDSTNENHEEVRNIVLTATSLGSY